MSLRVWLLTNAPSPYQMEFLRDLGASHEIDLSVRFMRSEFRGDECAAAIEQLGAVTYSAIGLSRRHDELRLHCGALREIMSRRHDLYVLSGLYTSPTVILAACLLRLRSARYLLWLERPSELRRRDRNRWGHLARIPLVAVRKLLLKFLFAGAARIVCIGSRAAEQYAELGLAAHKTSMVPYCCDTARFQSVPSADADKLRESLGIQNRLVFLYSGQLIHRKGIDTLLKSYGAVCSLCPNTALLVLGDGELRNQSENAAAALTQGKVVFAGQQPQSQLPVYFACGDVFVFPTRHDGWGVVLNEACAAGLPVISSVQAGAAHDLVGPGENGFLFDAEDVDGLVRHMLYFAEHREMLPAFRAASRERAELCSTAYGVKQFLAALKSAAA
jgi:glycosyltransferase involved in cell wall biosynthesis